MKRRPLLARSTLALTLAALITTACMGDPVILGNIPPTTFQFKTVIDWDGDLRGGGWKVAQVIVLLGRISAMFPRTATCDVQVGVPVVNHKGAVSDEFAQQQSAIAADCAARELMGKRARPTAPVCTRFRKTMQRWLTGANRTDGPIPGARVTKFTFEGIPQRTFPPKRGR